MDVYFDIFSGISGNMILGAVIDLGVEKSELEQELGKLGISDEYKIKTEKVTKEGISGTYVEVELLEKNNSDKKEHNHKHHHQDQSESSHSHHDHEHSGHSHESKSHSHGSGEHDHNHENSHSHSHGRNLSDIESLIDDSELSDSVKEKSKEIFLNLAKAEAKIHNKDINEIHFHEVGAVDAIVDIVGAVIGLELLEIEEIYASSLHTGTGFVNCEHGKMPVPAPATMELLEGIPFYSTGIRKELVTPTGAAIITTLADNFGDRPEMIVEKTGYGAGGYDLEIPNLLRINLGQIKSQKKN